MSNFYDGKPPPPGEPPRRPNPDRPSPERPDGQPMPPWASPPQQPDQSPWGQPSGQPGKSDSPWKDQPPKQPGSPWQEPPSRQQSGQPGTPWQNQPPRQPAQPRQTPEPHRSYVPDKPTSGNSANEWAYEHPPSPTDESTAVMSTKDWLITYLLMIIPCAGFIITIIWAFSSTGNLNRRNYSRAILILILIFSGLFFLFWILLFALGATLGDMFLY